MLCEGLEEPSDGADGSIGWVVEVSDGREGAEVGVDGDFFDDLGLAGILLAPVAVGFGFGEVEAGDLEAVEEEAGAAGIDVVGGDAAENFADGKLNAGTIVGIGQRKVEDGAAASALLRVGDGFSGGVVVVAEVFSAQAGAAAAVAVGEDVAALVAFGLVLHGVAPLWVLFLCKVFEGKGLSLDLWSRLPFSRLKAKARLLAGLCFFFLLLFY